MGARRKNSVLDVLELSIPERILAVEKIWDSIADQPDLVPVTRAQKDELDSRINAVGKTSTWSQVKRRIQSKSKK